MLVITHLVAVIHIKLLAPNLRMGFSEICGDSFCVHFGNTALHLSRVGDVTVVGDAAAFLGEEIITVVERLHLIAVADIRPEQSPCDILIRLGIVRTFAIQIIECSTHLNGFVHIAREQGLKTVLIAVSVASKGIRHNSHWYASVIIHLIANRGQPCAQSIFEEKVGIRLSVEEYLVLSLSPIVAGGCIGIAHKRRHNRPEIIILKSVNSPRKMQSQRFGDGPSIRRFHLLPLCCPCSSHRHQHHQCYNVYYYLPHFSLNIIVQKYKIMSSRPILL